MILWIIVARFASLLGLTPTARNANRLMHARTFVGLLLAARGGWAQSVPSCEVPRELRAERSSPLNLADTLVGTFDGVEVYRIVFDSPRGGRVPGMLWRPAAAAPSRGWAGVVLQHGMPGTVASVKSVAGNVALHGAVVIAIDAPFARRAGPPVSFTERDSAEQIQLIADLGRGFDILAARRDVDAGRMAYVGRSYGGAMGGLLAAVEHRPKAFVLIVADGGLVSHVEADSSSGLFRLPLAQRDRWLAAMRPIEPIRFIHCATGNLLFHSARRDQFVKPDEARRLHAAAPPTKTVRWYDLDHNVGAASLVDELTWLHDVIGTAPARPINDLWCSKVLCLYGGGR
jgi:dienelactone hydrolase